MTLPGFLKSEWPVMAVLALLASFWLATLREGHGWGDDFALYILHARNLAEGKPYTATGYHYNPEEPGVGPPVYPPVTPLVLAGVQAAAGPGLHAMKAALAAAFLAGLFFFSLLLAMDHAPGWRAALTALVGFAPPVWDMRDRIGSDLLFILWVALALWAAERAYRQAAGAAPSAARGIATGFAVYLACGTRTIGLALLPALWLYELGRFRRPTRFLLSITAIAGGLLLLQSLWLGTRGENNYFAFFEPRVFRTALLFWHTFQPSRGAILFGAAAAAALIFIAAGAWRQVNASGIRPRDLFLLVYAGALLLFSFGNQKRYLLVLLPLVLSYAITAVKGLLARMPAGVARPALAAALAAAAAGYGWQIRRADLAPIREGLFDPGFRDVCDRLRAVSEPGELVVFRKAKLMALASGRAATPYVRTADGEALSSGIIRQGARWAVSAAIPHPEFDSDRRYFQPAIDRHTDRFRLVYSHAGYRLYQVQADRDAGARFAERRERP